MRSDSFVKLKYESSTTIYILCVTYFLTSITMTDRKLAICVRYGNWCQCFLWHQLAIASCEFYIWTISRMEIYVKISFTAIQPYFLFYLALNMILSDALILPVSQLQTQQVMTSRIRSHMEYLIHTSIFLRSFCSQNWWKNLALMAGLITI